MPTHAEFKTFGVVGFGRGRADAVLHPWFDLALTPFYTEWKGRLVVGWPPERSWWRRAHRNDIPILAILEDSSLNAAMPEWDSLSFTWDELRALPTPWKAALRQSRGIHYIFDSSDAKAYVGAAYGRENLLGRSLNYVEPDMGKPATSPTQSSQFPIHDSSACFRDMGDAIRLEASWKERLHTRSPHGFNDLTGNVHVRETRAWRQH
jgi:hypothetical protein